MQYAEAKMNATSPTMERMGETIATSPDRVIRRAIVLNCFGRGGSSIVWNLIGSSPDVLMPNNEWHQGFYGRWQIVGRALKQITRPTGIDIPTARPLSRLIYRRACAVVPPHEWRSKLDASSIVLKLMDYHLAMNSVVTASFSNVSQVILVRHPLAQCESLLRSGANLRSAARWYVDVMDRMISLTKTTNAFVLRFDDIVRDPFAARDEIYRELGITVPPSGSFRMKCKKFGEQRTPDTGRATGAYMDVTRDNVSELIDENVNERAIMRLTEEERAFIWRRTERVASYFGYRF